MKLTIHVGLHKTGSTYIQNTLFENYYELIKNGFLFPKTGFVSLANRGGEPGSAAGHDLFVKAALTHDRGFKTSLMRSLFNEIAETAPTNILISAENFTNHLLGDISKNTYLLFGKSAPTRILISLRNPYEWVESYYRDRVTSGWEFEKLPLSQFIRKHEVILNYSKIIRQWKHSFGSDNVDIIVYGETLKKTGLLNAYRTYLGINNDINAAQARINESASDHFVQSALIFNKKSLPTLTARNILTKYKMAGFSKGIRTSLLDDHDMNFIENKFLKWNTNIENLNFAIGTFEELRKKPTLHASTRKDIDFSKELISTYQRTTIPPREFLTGILKFLVSYMPTQMQIIMRRLWTAFSKNAY